MQHVTTKKRPTAVVDTSPEEGIIEQFEELVEEGAVEVAPAPDAIVCSALGCHVRTYLLEGYVQGFGERIFCGLHLAKLIRRELVDDE